jgi:hypothetical protein
MAPDDFATPEDIHAARPDVPLDSIRRHCRDGVIRAVKVGRSWVIPEAEALRYVRTYQRYARNNDEAGAVPPDAPASTVPPSNEQES